MLWEILGKNKPEVDFNDNSAIYNRVRGGVKKVVLLGGGGRWSYIPAAWWSNIGLLYSLFVISFR